MSVKFLTECHLELLSLKGGCTGSPDSSLVKMSHCWKSHVTAQMCTVANSVDPEEMSHIDAAFQKVCTVCYDKSDLQKIKDSFI